MKYKVVITAALTSFVLTLTLSMATELPDRKSWREYGNRATAFIDPETVKSFDLNSMLENIDKKTKQLGEVNRGILQSLFTLDNKSAKTKTVNEKLGTVNRVSAKQSETLGEIRDVTGEQVTLSRNLNALSKNLSIQMRIISDSGQTQASNSTRLKSITTDTLDKLREALEENKRLEQKLKSAASKSDRAARSLP
ncbi:hypothetical protein ACFO25_18830 [Paenactinomyces guangxiensis]|uniref:Uncharacterized protein n=1 Tax=Paenactinomyces guangxiensis TaxID=1490290 RepID=A0A7W1WR13_9BACL|nr:hypothetical protein [Paenactinomyces guangxiensis]MBA4494502.1 hypothetical protein [Paenactinomyces guangxiensis]MBH8591443.1 hypothetical protein [Paenactinomyces guangxiensis]